MITEQEVEDFAWAKDKTKPKTEVDVMSKLDTCGYQGKFKHAMQVARQGEWYWNQVVDHFLALGGLLTCQKYNNGLNSV